MIARFVAYAIAAAVAALLAASISQERLVSYSSVEAVAVFALAMGLLDTSIVPVLRVVTFPLTCLTFGLFALLLNAGVFGLAALVAPGMVVTFWGAVLGGIIASITSGVVYSLMDER